MKNSLPTRTLREHPDIAQLKRQAKELLRAFTARQPAAIAEVNAHYRAGDSAAFALHDAQLVLARSYGFESWPKLKAYVDGINADRLCEAVEAGDRETARRMLRRRPEIVNLERPRHGEFRALHFAVLRRDADMVRLLMQHGADARRGIYPNRDATSALRFAIERGYQEIEAIIEQEELRRSGARPEAARLPPEFEAALRSGDQSQAIALLEAHPAVRDYIHPDGWTLLHLAAGRLQENVTAWLLHDGADPNRRAQGQWTPLDYAASGRAWPDNAAPQDFEAIAKILLHRGAEPSAVSEVALGDEAAVRSRHSAGALRNAPSVDLFGPSAGLLATAVLHNRPEMLTLLLDLGLDPDERVRLQGSEPPEYSLGGPLYLCARSGKPAMAEILLARGADPNAPVYASGSPLFAAYSCKDSAMIQLLERHGGALDAASAGYVRHTELARMMLAGEADPHLAGGTFSGETVAEQLLWSGASGGDPEIVRMSLPHIHWQHEDPRWFRMLWRPLPGHSRRPPEEHPAFLDCFRQILDRSDPNLRAERTGQTMLHEVVARDHGEGVGFATLLLDAGAKLDIRDHLLCSTPLGWACRWGRLELVRLFLARGADPVEAAAEPWATPRAWAEKMGHAAVLALLP